MSQNFNIKKIIPSIFKSPQKGLDESNNSNDDGDNFILQDQPVRVQIAFTKTKSDGTKQLLSKESLTKMMRNNEEFDSFVRNEYKLNSTVIVEGVNDGDKRNPLIYVSGHIPVNVRRTINGNKRNKEIHISGKLYKPESRRTADLKRSQSVMDERTNLRNTTLRKVELPLTQLRSSLSGFTRRITDFEIVPWLTATYIPNTRSQVSSKSELSKKSTSRRKLDSPIYLANSIHDKNMIAMPTNLEYNQFPAGNYKTDKESLIYNPYANVKTINEQGNMPKEIRSDLKEESKRNAENIMDKSVSHRKSYFEHLHNGTKSDPIKSPQQSDHLIEKFQTQDSKKSFNDRKSYFEFKAEKKPEISEHTLDSSKSSNVKDVHKKLESFSKSLNEKRLKLLNGPNSIENSNISNYVTVSNLTCDQIHCNRNVEENKSSNNQMLIPTNKKNADLHEEIPVSSITITRSRTRIIKYDDGTGIEEKIGRQTFRVEAPNGSLYTCKTCLWPIIGGDNNNNEVNNKIVRQNEVNNKSKIDELNREDEVDKEQEDDDDDNNNSNNYSIYATQNIYQLNYPKEKEENENEKYDFNEVIGDKYNPLTWLYNNYAKTKNLIKQFNHE